MAWQETTLGKVIELKRGYDLPNRLRTPGRFPLVSSSGISDTHAEAKVAGPGVVTGRYGTIGEVYFVEEDFWPLNTTLYVKDFKGNDPRFISYFLQTLNYGAYTDKAAVPGVNRNHLHQELVRIPAIGEQRRIMSTLGALDDKIDLNGKMNRTLEEISQTLFRAWFVDFEGETDLVESDLGAAPKGWEQVPVGDCIELVYGRSLPERLRTPGAIEVYGSGGRVGSHEAALVEAPGVVVGRKGTVGSIYWVDTDFWPIDTTFYVKVRDERLSLLWTYWRLREMDLVKLASDSAVPGVNRNAVYSRIWTIPSSPEPVGDFDRVVQPLMERARINRHQSRTLAEIRDTLLPKLISGEIRVPEAAEIVEDAGASPP